MEVHTTCTICEYSYNSSENRPLVLPCSHSFCNDCLGKLEAAGSKFCPVCRKTWHHVGISDLPSCYQLIPEEEQSDKEGLHGAVSAPASDQAVCAQHGDEYIYWCKSCEVPLCKKCYKLKHKGCDFILMEEKFYLSSLEEKNEQHSARLFDSTKELSYIRPLIEKLISLENDFLNYQSKVEAWQVVARKILSQQKERLSDSDDTNKPLEPVGTYCSKDLEKLEQEIPATPSLFLVHVARAYESSNENVDVFVSDLKASVDVSEVNDPSRVGPLSAQPSDLSIAEAITALSDGGDWIVADATSSAAVQRVLQTTSMRPAKVEVTWGNVPDELIFDLQALCNCQKYWTLDCFHLFDKSSLETCTSTSIKLDTLIQSDNGSTLKQFWGHLAADAVQKLPVTIESVGLALRGENDMEAVNALCEVAFKTNEHRNDKDRLKWPAWTDLNLSIAKTFQPEYWEMSWWWYALNSGVWSHTNLSLSMALPALGVRLRIHLPQVVLDDRRWMRDLFRVMGLEGIGFRGPVPLHLPGARIDPDPLLGVLRDSGQRWEVHLPASLQQVAPKEEVVERFKEFGHSVTWDLE